jgi:hypothetical protein
VRSSLFFAVDRAHAAAPPVCDGAERSAKVLGVNLQRLLSLSAVALLTACPAAQVKSPPPPPPPALQGAWQSDCLPIKNADDTDGSARLVYGVTPSLWALDALLFGDEACGVPVGTIHSDGGWGLERPSTMVPGAWEVRLDVRTRTVTPHAEGFIAYLESLGCGRGHGVDRASDMLDVACPALGLLPLAACPVEYDVVAGDGVALRFGARGLHRERCDPRSRPPTLGPPLRRLQ